MVKYRFDEDKDKKINNLYNIIKTATLILVAFAIFFVHHILTNEFNSSKTYMEQAVQQTASNLNARIKNSMKDLQLLAALLSKETDTYTPKEIESFLSKHISDYNYYKLFFVYPNGTAISYQNDVGRLENFNLKSDPRFKEAIAGNKVFVTIKDNSSESSGYVNGYGIPVYNKHNKIAGVICAQIRAESHVKVLGFNNYNEKGFSYVIDSNGEYIIKPPRDNSPTSNFFDDDKKFVKTTEHEVRELLKSQKHGVFLYNQNKEDYIASFAMIDIKDRYVLTVVPMHVLMLDIDNLLKGITVIVVLISLLLIFLLYYSKYLFKQNEKTIYEIAFSDDVTGNGNKNKFLLEAQSILRSEKNSNYAMIALDISKFKAINELYGVEHANKILKDVYEIIKKNLTDGSICVRDYAATFIILYKYEKKEFITKYFTDKVTDEIELYNENSMQQLSRDSGVLRKANLSLSFGIYLIDDINMNIDEMCEKAYIVLKNIKDDVINKYKFYDAELRNKILNEKEIEDKMYPALNNKEFHMYLQPKFEIKSSVLAGAEALVRWISPEKGIIPPMSFIPLFEENGFVIELDRCIWQQACEFLSERKKSGKNLFPISVNVSRLHLNNDVFISELVLLTKKYDIEPKFLELEVTESACFNNEKRFTEVINKLKELGFTISMDDFGTGYSSLNMIRHLPVDVLKLDRGFIKDTINDNRGKIVIDSVINMANKLNMVTVAEGVEFEEQVEFLKQVGCQIGQGFLYGKPVNIDEFKKLFLKEDITA